jgi:hypothetical protein
LRNSDTKLDVCRARNPRREVDFNAKTKRAQMQAFSVQSRIWGIKVATRRQAHIGDSDDYRIDSAK